MNVELLKKKAGHHAAELIKDRTLVGIGTGSTVFYFIERLVERYAKGLDIQAVSSSDQSTKMIKKGGIPLVDMNNITSIDIVVDGADEVDSQKRMIKGAGGALLREKIIANISNEMIVIVDETKRVETLGKCKLPVEILPFFHNGIINKIQLLGFKGELRQQGQEPYKTDNGNYIYDIEFKDSRTNPENDHYRLIQIPGVIETGYFFNLAKHVIVAKEGGELDIIN